MKINLIRRNERKWKLLLVSIFFIVNSTQSQCILSKDDKQQIKDAKVEFYQPNTYFCINPLSSYFSIHPEFLQGQFTISLINKDNQIMIGIFTMPYPKGITRAEKFLIETVDLNHISKKALVQEMDTRLSQLRFVKTDYLKKINADRGYVYNTKTRKGGYLGIYPRCKKVIVYKDNVGRAEILFFYKYGQDALVKQEIERTWGLLKFKP